MLNGVLVSLRAVGMAKVFLYPGRGLVSWKISSLKGLHCIFVTCLFMSTSLFIKITACCEHQLSLVLALSKTCTYDTIKMDLICADSSFESFSPLFLFYYDRYEVVSS